MPARPVRRNITKDTAKKFGDVPFSDTILTEETFAARITELESLISGLSGKLMTLSGEYLDAADDLESLSGELYSTTFGASGDIWNLSAAIAELQPTTTNQEVEASNKK